jgi:hypothetical protein
MGGARYEIESLKGCLEKAPGSQEYLLTHVLVPPVSAQLSDALSSRGLTVRDGSSVRLSDGSDQLKRHVGELVSVSGTIIADGRNTVGTSGQASQPDGGVPEMAVERVNPTGQACAAPAAADR